MTTQKDLFDTPPTTPDDHAFLHRQKALQRHGVDTNAALIALKNDVPWRRDSITFMGKEHLVPRLTQWYGDAPYTYSGIEMKPLSWSTQPVLAAIKKVTEYEFGRTFNSALLNFYRSGRDHVSWHSDDERELGPAPVIASVSLGAMRDFMVRKTSDHTQQHCFELDDGDMLMMFGASQRDWQHSLPKRMRVGAPRINITFREIKE